MIFVWTSVVSLCGQAKINGGQILSRKCSDDTARLGIMFWHHHYGKHMHAGEVMRTSNECRYA